MERPLAYIPDPDEIRRDEDGIEYIGDNTIYDPNLVAPDFEFPDVDDPGMARPPDPVSYKIDSLLTLSPPEWRLY